MTKENLIDVYNILKKCADESIILKFDSEVIERIKKLTDKDIEMIKQSPYPWHLFKLLSNINFKEDVSPETQTKIIDIINHAKKETILFTSITANDITLLQESIDYPPYFENETTIIKILTSLSKAKGIEQTKDAYNLIKSISHKYYADEEKLPKLVDVITTCRSDSISHIVRDYLGKLPSELIWLDSTLTIAKKLSNAKSSFQTEYGQKLARDYNHRKKISDIIKFEEREEKAAKLIPMVDLIVKEKDAAKTADLYKVLTNKSLIEFNLEYEAARLIKNAYRYDTTTPALNVAQCDFAIYNLPRDTFLELIKTVGDIKNLEIALSAKKVATSMNTILYNPEQICRLTKIIGKATGNVQAYLASDLASDKDVLESGYAFDLVSIVALAGTEYQADYAHSFASKPKLLGVDRAMFWATEASLMQDESKLSMTSEEMEKHINTIKSRRKDMFKEELNGLYDTFDALFDIYDTFWHAFESNPEEAIATLSESTIGPKEDINSKTKIKVRKFKKQ